MIYATVGTLFLDFPRLVGKMDAIAAESGERVIVQTGMGTTIPEHCEYFDFKSRDEVIAIQRDARVIVCHGGIGTLLDALEVRRPIVMVPRRKAFNEHLTDHQMDVAEAVARRGWARVILDIDELPDACAQPPEFPADYAPAQHRLIGSVRDMVERAAARKAAHREGVPCSYRS